jgi:nucleoside-diphosphate-sugar epimerase
MQIVIGDGMIATSFKQVVFSKDVLVFASGVSNSLENDSKAFKREEMLLRETITAQNSLPIIYFSTCSIYSKVKNSYILHKLKMEDIVKELSSSYFIYRLPQVVGSTSNSTLVSFFANQINSSKNLEIQILSKRNLIDCVDVAKVIHFLVENSMGKDSIQNIATPNNIEVIEIAKEISLLLGKKLIFSKINSGDQYSIPIDFLTNNLKDFNYLNEKNYWQKVLRKYVRPLTNL